MTLEIEQRLAHTYKHPSYEDPYDAVQDYRRVQRAAANHPNKGSHALATLVELPRSRIRSWVESETDGMPDAARAIDIAHSKGWIAPSGETAVALATLVGHLLGGGSIATDSYVPSICEGRRVTVADIEQVFETVGVHADRRHETSDTRSTEVLPAEHASVLGRTLVAWGCPQGGRDKLESLPVLLDYVDTKGHAAFVKAYVLHRAVNYPDKATSRLHGQQSESFHRSVVELIRAVTGADASYDARGVTVSATAMRALGLAE